MSAFLATTGSVLGREHARLFRNNQDGVAARVEGGLAVAVVTDGCGSGASSEVGARLGARFLAEVIPGLVREVGVTPQLAERATAALVGWLAAVVRPFEATLPVVLNDQWLFTVLCAVMDEKASLIFGVGDGGWAADGAGQVLDPGPENAPDYVAYRLLPPFTLRPFDRAQGQGERLGVRGAPVIHHVGNASQLLIATDGLTDLTIDDPSIWKNPYALERKLRLLRPHDDATVALLKRAA